MMNIDGLNLPKFISHIHQLVVGLIIVGYNFVTFYFYLRLTLYNQTNIAMKNNYTLYWKDGKSEVISGKNIREAFKDAGYTTEAKLALEIFTDGNTPTHQWNGEVWEPIKPSTKQAVIELLDQRLNELARSKDQFEQVRDYDTVSEIDGSIKEVQLLKERINKLVA